MRNVCVYTLCLILALFCVKTAYNESERARESEVKAEALQNALESYFRTRLGKVDLAYRCVKR